MNQQSRTKLLYEVGDTPKTLTSMMLGFQGALLMISGVALTPVIVLRGANIGSTYDSWVIFAALLVCGITTFLQGRPIWKFGSGYSLFMGTSGAFIAVGISAVNSGGLPLLAALATCSAFFQFLLSWKLNWLRRIITPEVGGVVVMLIVVTVFPICTDLLHKVPADKSGSPAAITAAFTFFSIVGLALFGKGKLRLWGPILGILIGCTAAGFNGLFSLDAVREAPLIGLPSASWPGIDLSFGQAFWSLMPGFVIVTIVGAIETYGDAISIQKVSHNESKPVDYRVIQRALYTDGLGNFLSGLLGTLPNTTYSSSISLVEFTKVASRKVAVFGGLLFIILAFFPKVSALLQAIPNPVIGAYVIVFLAILFISGLRLVAESGLDYERGLVISLAFWVGIAFQNQMIFPELIPDWLHTILDNGMTAGGFTAIFLNLIFVLLRKREKGITFSPADNPFPIAPCLPQLKSEETRLERR